MKKKSLKNFFKNIKERFLTREVYDESEFENFEDDDNSSLLHDKKSNKVDDPSDFGDEEFEDKDLEDFEDEDVEDVEEDEEKIDYADEDSEDWEEEENTEDIEEVLTNRKENHEELEEEFDSSEFQTMTRPEEEGDTKDEPKENISVASPPQTTAGKVSQFKESIADLSWEHLIVDLFSPIRRPIAHKIFLISLITVSSLLMGKLVAQKLTSLLKPSRSLAKSKPVRRSVSRLNLKPIEKYNIFNSEDLEKVTTGTKKVKKKVAKKVKCDKANKKSSLPIKLLNTIVLQDSSKSLASISIKGGTKLQDMREGDKIGNMAKIGKITRLRLTFKNLKSEQCEFVGNKDQKFERKFKKKKLTILDPKTGKKLLKKKEYAGIKNEGNKYKISPDLKSEMLSDISNVLSQARAIQIKNPDGSLAFKITEVVAGSIYSKLNINDGDIISKIDGKPIENLNDIMTLFGRIKDVQNLSLTLKRNGEEETQEYSFGK